jgi:hypothetical protein
MSWSEVVDKNKRISHTLQNKPCLIPVINNRYNLLCLNERHVSETVGSCTVQQTTGTGEYNKKILNMKQNKIIILGVIHTRGCAQEVQHYLECDYSSRDSETGSRH